MTRLHEFFNDNKVYQCSYTQLSASDDGKKKSLIYSDKKEAYSFDQITKLFFKKFSPSSADAILFREKKIFLIEFKSGFERKKFDRDKCICDHTGKICEDYAKVLERNIQNINRELQANLFQKAAESRWILQQHLLPQIYSNEDEIKDVKVFYNIVIDKVKDNPIDAMGEIMDDLSNTSDSENIYTIMKQSLKKIYCENYFTRKPSFYDYAEVLSVEEFKEKFVNCI